MNQLIHATSPYLLQHAHNPVHWFPYSEEALQKAKTENKLIIISIGYSACHWCHVMEKESFENEEVAALMNEHFVSIKIDREERPDIDKIYMDAVIVMTQQGGWPLNCICLPDGRPLFGGTYFPRQQWINVLERVAKLFSEKKDYAFDYAHKLTNAMQEMAKQEKNEGNFPFLQEDLSHIVLDILQDTDKEWGGQQSHSNKFPLPTNQIFLLESLYYIKKYQFPAQLQAHTSIAIHNTLTRMALGGIFDQVGGGFARYSTDKYWHVPHFEKMLYDNAQLISLYAQAYHSFPNHLYKNVVYQTIDFIEKELSAPEAGFYSALDADSEGVEGKFYVWQKIEIEAAFLDTKWTEFLPHFCEYYRITAHGNWEEGNVLWSTETLEIYSRERNVPNFVAAAPEMLKQLYNLRKHRIRPALDDKILTSWNALMIKALTQAAMIFGEEKWLNIAEKNAEFLWQNMTGAVPRGKSKDTPIPIQLFRNYKNGQASIPAFLDDYAFLIAAYLELFSTNLQEIWLKRALHLWYFVAQNFYDEKTGMFFYTQGNPDEIVRKYDTSDDVMPSSCSVLAHCLFVLHKITGEEHFNEKAKQMLQNVAEGVLKKTYWYGNWASLMLKYVFPQHEVVVTGAKTKEFLSEIRQTFAADCLYFGTETESEISLFQHRYNAHKTRIFVCKDHKCDLPLEETSQVKIGI